uniref:Secreted protein n=1 Tax=Oryza sativa subsp. japonica TaxID=39947 RepID=Q6K2T8_ORYSJ|nr:hypothetical protein [Oryza sativa Japonica Group]
MAPGALSNGLWLAWAGCAQTNQPMCVFGVVARLLGFSSLLHALQASTPMPSAVTVCTSMHLLRRLALPLAG